MLTINPSSKNEVKTNLIKNLTSLSIKNQKILINSQKKHNVNFLVLAKTLKIVEFLNKSKFLLCFRFIETSKVSSKLLMTKLSVDPTNVLFINDILACEGLVRYYGKHYSWIAKILSGGSLYLINAANSKSHTALIKTCLSLETNESSENMFSLVFSKENEEFVDFSYITSSGKFARNFYKSWDSRESILIELSQINLTLVESFTSLFEKELVGGSNLASSQITFLGSLTNIRS